MTSSPTLHPDAQTELCAACGCSLVRLGIERDRAPRLTHDGQELRFCCEGCLGVFRQEPDRLLEQIRDIVVCPSCLGEKHISRTVAVEHDGGVVRFCHCPGCAEAFKKDPERLLQRLAM